MRSHGRVEATALVVASETRQGPRHPGDIRFDLLFLASPGANRVPDLRIANGGLDPQGHGLSLASAGRDETANADGDRVFVSHEERRAAGAGGEFDDMVQWLPNSSYQAAMLGR